MNAIDSTTKTEGIRTLTFFLQTVTRAAQTGQSLDCVGERHFRSIRLWGMLPP